MLYKKLTRSHQPVRTSLAVAYVVPAWMFVFLALAALPAYGQGPAPGDADIQAAVTRLFEDDPLLDATTVGVRVEEGIATLQGLARDLRDRDRAQRLASRVRGVRSIINSIRVPSLNISDGEVATDVRAALQSEPVTRDLDIEVAARGGEVVLSGRVDSLVARKAAYVITSGVRGVQGVDIAGVDVVSGGDRSGEQLEREIEARWAWNVWTSQADLSVAVGDGTAVLNGVVPSLWVRDLAADLASIPGIARVDATAVGLLPAGNNLMLRDRPTDFTDDEIREAIEKALFFDFEIFAADVDVEVKNSRVILSGSVPTLAQREKAGVVAGDTVGASVVRNDLAIRVADAPSDERLVQLVKDRLGRSPRFVDESPIGVTAQAGIVTLFGTVGDLIDKRRAEELAKQQFGVTGVVNALQVSG